MKKVLPFIFITVIVGLIIFGCDKNSTENTNDEDVILDISNNFIKKITWNDLSGAEQYVTSDFIWITDYDSLYVPGDGDISDLHELIEYWVDEVESIQQVTLSSNVEINNNEASVQFTLDSWHVTTENWIKLRKNTGWKIYQFICDL